MPCLPTLFRAWRRKPGDLRLSAVKSSRGNEDAPSRWPVKQRQMNVLPHTVRRRSRWTVEAVSFLLGRCSHSSRRVWVDGPNGEDLVAQRRSSRGMRNPILIRPQDWQQCALQERVDLRNLWSTTNRGELIRAEHVSQDLEWFHIEASASQLPSLLEQHL